MNYEFCVGAKKIVRKAHFFLYNMIECGGLGFWKNPAFSSIFVMGDNFRRDCGVYIITCVTDM